MHTFEDLSPQTIPSDPRAEANANTPPPMNSFEGGQEEAPTSLEHRQSPFHTVSLDDHWESEYLVERMRSIDFGTSQSQSSDTDAMGGTAKPIADDTTLKSSTPPPDFFPIDMPLAEFFPQYMNRFEGLQLSGLGAFDEGDTIVGPQDKERERNLSFSMGLESDFPVEFDMLAEFVETPLSGATSSCGSGLGSSPPSRQQYDFEESFAQ
jgi:hypothetical protein